MTRILAIESVIAAILLVTTAPVSSRSLVHTATLMQEQKKRRSPRKGLLTQREVAMVLGLSERAVRDIERRALAKLRHHPSLRKLCRELGIIEEAYPGNLSLEEIHALFGLTRTPEEQRALAHVLLLIASN